MSRERIAGRAGWLTLVLYPCAGPAVKAGARPAPQPTPHRVPSGAARAAGRAAGVGAVKLGLALEGPEERLVERARRLGFESLWLTERPGADVLADLAALAPATAGLRLGALDYALERRSPLDAARAIAALDRATGGRAEIGVAPAEASALDEALTLCRKLFADPHVEHRGAHFALERTQLAERPLQRPWPPLHVSGDSERALWRAARRGDGWIAVADAPESVAHPLARLRELRVEAETQDGRFEVSVRCALRSRDDLERWRRAGVSRLILTADALALWP